MDKNMLIGVGGMLVGGALVVVGLLKIAIVPVILILIGGAVGFTAYKVFKGEIVL